MPEKLTGITNQMAASGENSPARAFYLFIARLFAASALAALIDALFLLNNSDADDPAFFPPFLYSFGLMLILLSLAEFLLFSAKGLYYFFVSALTTKNARLARLAALSLFLLPAFAILIIGVEHLPDKANLSFFVAGYALLIALLTLGGFAALERFLVALLNSEEKNRFGFTLPLLVVSFAAFAFPIYVLGVFVTASGLDRYFFEDPRLLLGVGLLVIFAFAFAPLANKLKRVAEKYQSQFLPLVILALVIGAMAAGFSAMECARGGEAATRSGGKTLFADATARLYAHIFSPTAKKTTPNEIPTEKTPEKNLPNFFIVTVENLPLSSIACAETLEKRLPILNKLKQKGLYFSNSYTPSPRAPYHFASVICGRSPSELSLEHTPDRFPTLSGDNLTLAEALKKEGYRTELLGTGDYLYPRYGFDQGFDDWQVFPQNEKFYDNIHFLAANRLDYLLEEGGRFLLWLNFGSLISDAPDDEAKEIQGGFVCPSKILLKRFNDSLSAILDYLSKSPLSHKTVVALMPLSGVLPNYDKGASPLSLLVESNVRTGAFLLLPTPAPQNISASLSLSSFFDLFAELAREWNGEADSVERIMRFAATRKEMPFMVESPVDAGISPEVAFFSKGWKLIYKIDEGSHRLYNLETDEAGEKEIGGERPLRLSLIKAEMAKMLGSRVKGMPTE